jgi:Glycosyltransferase family 87/WD40-like Beta Propeller Repeat
MPQTFVSTGQVAMASPAQAVHPIGVGRVVVMLEWLVLLAAIGYFGVRTLPRAWGRLNTDFPNYYITARLVREGYNTNRLYEWIWFQRQKDRFGITRSDQPVVGFVPDTPFSGLVVLPFTYWTPLSAKHAWIVTNLLLLGWVAVILQSLTGLGWRRVGLLTVLNYPAHRNLENGQFYILLLLIVTLALWLYVRAKPFLAGIVMGVACGLKIFPICFVLYFMRKRDLRAATGLIAGALGTVLVSIAAFGTAVHRIYLSQILGWALHGEALDPYNLVSNSLSSLLHAMLIFEPEWNPHPLIHAPALVAVLRPLLQLMIFAPAILLARPGNREPRQLQLEWSGFVISLLAISTLPASYHFTLLLLPVTVMAARFVAERDRRSLALLTILYLAICFPAWQHNVAGGWWMLAAVPRLYFVILLCLLCYVTLRRQEQTSGEKQWEPWAWAIALGIACVIEVGSSIHHQQGVYDNYALRITTSPAILLATQPVIQDNSVQFIGMLVEGYHAGSVGPHGVGMNSGSADELSQTVADGKRWIEQAGRRSDIVLSERNEPLSKVDVSDAEFPVASSDGAWLAYLRSEKGRSRVWLHSLRTAQVADRPITPPELDVEEMTFVPGGGLVISAVTKNSEPELFTIDQTGDLQRLGLTNARYPSASPDGRWLAYSQQSRGMWNLWVRNINTGATLRVTNAECNDMTPAWEKDSKTLVYASDCGRALWFTALSRRRIFPEP